MEMAGSKSSVTRNSKKRENNFEKLFNDTMICSLIKYFILPRFSISRKEIMSLEDDIQCCSPGIEYILF